MAANTKCRKRRGSENVNTFGDESSGIDTSANALSSFEREEKLGAEASLQLLEFPRSVAPFGGECSGISSRDLWARASPDQRQDAEGELIA